MVLKDGSARDQADAHENSEGDEDSEEHEGQAIDLAPNWKVAPGEPHDDGCGVVPVVDSYFTVLYGLFPVNFTSFLRQPHQFLVRFKFPGANDIELSQDVVASRSERLRQAHVLHPFFFTFSAAEELDSTRFTNSEASDLVVACAQLVIPKCETSPKVSPRKVDGRGNNKAGAAGVGEVSSAFVESAAATIEASMEPVTTDPTRPVTATARERRLEVENTLLRKELAYSRYVTHEYMSSIVSTKRRTNDRDSAEDEAQRLVNINRALRQQVRLQEQTYQTLKREITIRKESSKLWIEGLERNALKKVETEKAAVVELDIAKAQLAMALERNETLTTSQESLRNANFLGNGREKALEDRIKELSGMESEVEKLRQQARKHQDTMDEFEKLGMRLEDAETKLETARLLQEARDAEWIAAKTSLERKLAETEGALKALRKEHAAKEADHAVNLQQSVEEALKSFKIAQEEIHAARLKAALELKELELRHREVKVSEKDGAGE